MQFVSPAELKDGLGDRLDVPRRLVRIDGEVWPEQPATDLPMAQRYFFVLSRLDLRGESKA